MSFAAAMVSVVLFAFLNLFHEHACGLESGDFVLRDDDGGVFGDVAGCLLGTCFDNEATEPRRYTCSPLARESFTTSMNRSIVVRTAALSMPVLL